jgi:hypothetical protein
MTEMLKDILEEIWSMQFYWDLLIGFGHYDFYEELKLNLKHQHIK